ncbi:hypothetical protein pclt_cds_927 [Pandoravirus celtis]|uniref:Uncharacterized protein n=1 Tax=Pandoravirus celtis TaxID=2568002 RepID=A0A4D6EJM8_9VIRU|nr:hypothetical protein pclt_cds_927 [Pandoravirus celtis]
MLEPIASEAVCDKGDGKTKSPAVAMPRVVAAAALLAEEIARRIAAIPKKQTAEGRRIEEAAADAALLRRCESATAHPVSAWTPIIDAFVAWLSRDRTDEKPNALSIAHGKDSDDNENDDDDNDDDDHDIDDKDDETTNMLLSNDGARQPDHPNSAASTASHFLGPLACMGIDIYAITTHPENAHLIGCCTKTPPLIEADCAYGDWRFVVTMERDVDCTGGILFIERAVHAPSGTSIGACCDLRCQNTSRGVRALLFSFFQSGQTSLSAFLHGVFAPFDRVADVLHAHGWDTGGKRFAWSDAHSALYPQRLACTRNDGVVVHLFWWSGTLVASGLEYGPRIKLAGQPASAYGPDPAPETPLQDDDDDDDSDDDDDEDDDDGGFGFGRGTGGARHSDDRAWLIDNGYIAPWVLAARWGVRPRNCPTLLLDPVHDTDDDLIMRMNAVADQIARQHGIDAGDMAARAYGHNRLNGQTCQAALDKMLTSTRSWRLAMRDRSIASGERYIDPDRGLYANWMVVCDMLPLGNRDDGTVRTTGLPFVRFQGHLLGVDERAASGPVQQAHVVVLLCEPLEPPVYAHQQRPMPPADGEQSRVAAMIHALSDNSKDPKVLASDVPLHPISAYYRQRCVDSRGGPKVLAILHEASSTHRGADAAGGFVAAIEWLMAEFETCAQTFGANAADATPSSSGWTLDIAW